MSISTKEDFKKLVDKMLGIIDSANNASKKIDNLIGEACGNIIENSHILTFEDKNSSKYSIHKMLPCNNKNSIIENNIILKKKNKSGGSSGIYPQVIEGKKFKYSQVLFDDNYKILFGYIFDYYLYNIINKSNYLCKTYEIGYCLNDNVKSFYSIMDDCGSDIDSFFVVKKMENEKGILLYKSTISINGKNKKSLNILFNNLLIIFYKMILGVKIVHDLGYVHLDIKPQNFLISSIDGRNLLDLIFTINIENIVLIKIIDFELVRKIGSTINIQKPSIGSIEYSHQNLLTNENEEIKENVVIRPIYDIMSLARSFIYIIGIIFCNNSLFKENDSDKYGRKKFGKILEELNELKGDNKPDKLDELLKILDNIGKNIYTNIDFLLNKFYCLLYGSTEIDINIKFQSTNVGLTNANLKTNLSKFINIEVSDYYSSLCSLKILEDVTNKYNSLKKYLLPIKDITTGYIIDDPSTKITYFRKISDEKYIPLRNYFEIILLKKENEYIKLTHVLHIFSLIMECIQLFKDFSDYGLNVLLDNFVIDKDTKLFTLEIDLKIVGGIVGGIVNTKIDTRPIQILGNEMFDILSNFIFFQSDKINSTNNIQTKLNKLINIKTAKEKSLIKSVKPEDIYRTELSEIIEAMIFDTIDIITLINKFKEIRKNIYLNEILNKYEEISMSKKTEVGSIISSTNTEIFSRKINLAISEYENKESNLESCMFGFLLYNYIYYFYKPQIQYLCEIEKIEFKGDKKYYSLINKNCGTNLGIYFKDKKVKPSNNKTIFFNNILKIFYEMLCCIEILHESGFLCVKPSENIFVIDNGKDNKDVNKLGNIKTNLFINNDKKQKLLVKIVDFSSVRKIGFTTKDANLFDNSSSSEIPSNWTEYSKKRIKMSEFKFTPYHDIFLLGQLFKSILENNSIQESDYENSRFKTIINKMCNINPSEGYEDIHSLVTEFGYLFKKNNAVAPPMINSKFIKKEGQYQIYSKFSQMNTDYKINAPVMPYIKDITNNKIYPITHDMIKKLAKTGLRGLRDINPNNLKELLKRKYINFNTLSKITGKEIDELNPNKKTFNQYANNLSKESNLKSLLEKSKNNLNNISNTHYIEYNKSNGKYKTITIKSILMNITKEDIEKIIAGTFLEKVPSNKNILPIDNGLQNILTILIEILLKKEKGKNPTTNDKFFFYDIYKEYAESGGFLLENIYKLLCEKFADEINKSTPNITTLIGNLKRINFLPYSFRDKQKKNNIEKLNKEDFFRNIGYDKLQEGQNYFYSPDTKSILYFGKLVDKGLIPPRTYTFKYYIGSDNLCTEIELTSKDLEGINFYEFNVPNKNNTKTLRRIGDGSSMFSGFKGMFSSPTFGSSSSSEKTSWKIGSLFSPKITCMDYDENSLPKINNYTDVDIWVKAYCDNNNIEIGTNITINRSSDKFTDISFGDFKDTEIYDARVGENDCLIRSLLFCMSDSYRKLDEDGRNSVGSYFRRAFLPWFFKENKNYFKKQITEKNNTLFIKDFIEDEKKNITVKLNDLLCDKQFLTDKIGDLLCKKLGINLLIFRPSNSKKIQEYFPSFINNNSKITICICGTNIHFRSCMIKYKEDHLNFILDKNDEEVEESIAKIQLIKSPVESMACPFSFGDIVLFKNNEYIILEIRQVTNEKTGKLVCDFYIVCNNSSNKNKIVISKLNHNNEIKKKEGFDKKSIDEILSIISRKYPTIIKNGKNINIPAKIINSLIEIKNISTKNNLRQFNRGIHESENNKKAKEELEKQPPLPLKSKPISNLKQKLLKQRLLEKEELEKAELEKSVALRLSNKAVPNNLLSQQINLKSSKRKNALSMQPNLSSSVYIENSNKLKEAKRRVNKQIIDKNKENQLKQNMRNINKYISGNLLTSKNENNNRYRNKIRKIISENPGYETNKLEKALGQINQAPQFRKIYQNQLKQKSSIGNQSSSSLKVKKTS
jgi:serine/threonine protein kinase